MNTSFFLQAEGQSADSTGDQSPIRQYESNVDETDDQSDSDSQSLREDDSQSDSNSDDASNSDSDKDHNSQHDNDNSLYSDDSGIE
jgi:clumping factor A